MPKFSIILPTYNRSFCISDSIDSVLQQTYTNYELIIIDDCSSDNTENLLKSKYQTEILSNKIRFLKNEKNQGVAYSRNVGIKNAKHEWIAYLDSDDIYDKLFLEKIKDAIIKNPNYKNFYCKELQIFKNRKNIVGGKFDYNEFYEHINLFIATPQYVHHISLADEVQYHDTKLIRGSDKDLILAHTKKYTPYFIDEILVYAHYDNDFQHISHIQDFGYCEQYIKNKHKKIT